MRVGPGMARSPFAVVQIISAELWLFPRSSLTMATGGVDAMTTKISEACEAGEKFMEVFYETMDKRRQVSCHRSLYFPLINAHH